MARTVFALIFTIVISVSFSTPIFAAAKAKPNAPSLNTGGFSLTPTIGGYFFTESERLASTPLYGVKIGYDAFAGSMVDSLGVEGTANYFTTKSKTDDGSATGYLFRIDLVYPFLLWNKWVPFLALGAGEIVINRGSSSEDSPLFNYGLGLKYFLKDYLALRADARHVLVYHDVDTRDNLEIGIGLCYLFGKERKKKPEPVHDKDQDGVPDSLDKCPDTPKGVKVDHNGCPLDSDKDGVANYLDKCPRTSVGVPVDNKGCPTEMAKTGEPSAGTASTVSPKIPESTAVAAPESAGKARGAEGVAVAKPVEKAETPTVIPAPLPVPAPAEIKAAPAPSPKTTPEKVEAAPEPKVAPPAEKPEAVITAQPAPGVVLSAPEAAVKEKAAKEAAVAQPSPVTTPAKVKEQVRRVAGKRIVKKLTVQFDFNYTYVKPKYFRQLRKIADILRSSPGSTALIEGHTDSIGKRRYNIKLSSQRAESVKNSLVKFGAEPGRISTKGYGYSKPVADNATEAGRQQNRRAVTIVIIFKNQ